MFALVLDERLRELGVQCAPASVNDWGILNLFLTTTHTPVDIREGQRLGVLHQL